MNNRFPIIIVGRDDLAYPELLKHIAQVPDRLYCRGNLELLKGPCLAVVGSRNMSPYGREVVNRIVGQITPFMTIVSGLALGVDGTAHQTALDRKGKTIAVLGSGIDDPSIYPVNHQSLANSILESGGLILSEYESCTPGLKHHFPARNRIISGLSLGVLIVEASQESGSLITARHALDQNREVFAVPGNIFSPGSSGPHELIRKGACLVTSGRDILEHFEFQPELFGTANIDVSTLDPVQKKILAILDEASPLTGDQIIDKSEIKTPEISGALVLLEIRGLIGKTSDGQYYLRTK